MGKHVVQYKAWLQDYPDVTFNFTSESFLVTIGGLIEPSGYEVQVEPLCFSTILSDIYWTVTIGENMIRELCEVGSNETIDVLYDLSKDYA